MAPPPAVWGGGQSLQIAQEANFALARAVLGERQRQHHPGSRGCRDRGQTGERHGVIPGIGGTHQARVDGVAFGQLKAILGFYRHQNPNRRGGQPCDRRSRR